MNIRSKEQKALNQEFINLASRLKKMGFSSRIIGEMCGESTSKIDNIYNEQSSATPEMVRDLKDGCVSYIEKLSKIAQGKEEE